ncbi:MAG: tetratricopeptide repeat protein [Bdellovibrionaceae bacterium]|nr:tetratricopeptide repeat protein [Pseudobdellovibrionaceae bacterium]MDW8190360.1 tetratricopeptide repeat protein [Pseudobdellovibrionaceae bacterium]
MKLRLFGLFLAVFVSGCVSIGPFQKGYITPQKGHSSPTGETEAWAQEKADIAFTRGEAYSQEGRHRLAIQYFREALNWDPSSRHIRLRLAKEFLKIQHFDDTLQLIEEVLSQDPSNVSAHFLKGITFMQLQKTQEAISSFQKVHELDPSHDGALINLVSLYLETKDPIQAIETLKKLIQQTPYPNPEYAHFLMGKIWEETNDPKRLEWAEQAYRKALELKPGYPEALLALAQNLHEQKKSHQAVELLEKWQAVDGPHQGVAEYLLFLYSQLGFQEKAIEQARLVLAISNQSPVEKVKLALLLIQQKYYAEAIRILEDVLSKNPSWDPARYALGLLYQETKNWEKAIEHFEQISPHSEQFPEAILQITQIYMNQKEWGLAEKVVASATKQRDDFEVFYLIWGKVLFEQQKYDKILGVLEKALRLFPKSEKLLVLYAITFEKLGKPDETIRVLKEILTINPLNEVALNNLAYLYAERGEHLSAALDMAQKALQLNPKNPYIQDTMGWIYYKLGDYQNAIMWLEKAVEENPNEAVILDHLGDVYLKVGFYEKAYLMYSLAQENTEDPKLREMVENKLKDLKKMVDVKKVKKRYPAGKKTKNSD